MMVLFTITGVQMTIAQETLKTYAFAKSYDSGSGTTYISAVVEGTVNDPTKFEPNSQNLENQWRKKLTEMTGKNYDFVHSTYGFRFNNYEIGGLNGSERKKVLNTESTLEVITALREEKIAECKKNNCKLKLIPIEAFNFEQPKK